MAKRAKRTRLVHNESMDVDDVEFSEKHQLLLTYLMHTRMVNKNDLTNIHKKLFNDDESLNESISLITAKVGALKMDIKRLKCDMTGETYYIIIHTAGESFFPRCSIFTKPQLHFLKLVLQGIVLSEKGNIGKIQALNSCEGLSKSEADETLRMFVKEKILVEDVHEGFLCLSPLAIVEFGPYFNNTFSENLYTCDLCRQFVFMGTFCQGCSQKFHRHCFGKWVNSNHSECPKCSKQLFYL